MPNGKVKWFSPAKSFDFITPDGGAIDVFVHVSTLQYAGIPTLSEGQRVQCEIQAGRDGKTSAHKLALTE